MATLIWYLLNEVFATGKMLVMIRVPLAVMNAVKVVITLPKTTKDVARGNAFFSNLKKVANQPSTF